MSETNTLAYWVHSQVSQKMKCCEYAPNGLYYKPTMIVNDDSSITNKLENSLIDDARVVIYDCHRFIVQAIGVKL